MTSPSTVDEAGDETQHQTATKRVLIVEDVADDALTLRELCMSWGTRRRSPRTGLRG